MPHRPLACQRPGLAPLCGYRLGVFAPGSRDVAPFFSGLVAAEEAPVMQDGAPATGLLVTGDYFQVLGARAAMGRLLTPNDATAPGGGAVVVLSHAAWRARHGADPAVIGKEIVLGRQRVTVVGVTEPGFGLVGCGFLRCVLGHVGFDRWRRTRTR